MPEMPDGLLTMQEAADIGRVSVRTLRRASQRVDLPVIHVGKRLRVEQ
jgi:hypothetical protein